MIHSFITDIIIIDFTDLVGTIHIILGDGIGMVGIIIMDITIGMVGIIIMAGIIEDIIHTMVTYMDVERII
jgi:hypothetical protein